MMDLSVIISTYNRPVLLRQTLSSFCSLDTTDLKWEVLVVNNAGDERTKAIVSDFSDRLPIRYLYEPDRGKNKALNRAIPEAGGKLLVFTDDDIIADPAWLVEIWEGAGRWPADALFGGRCLPKYPDNKGMPFEHPFFEGAYTIMNWDLPEGPYPAGNVWGTNLAVRSELFRKGWKYNPDVGPTGSGNYLMGSETELTTRLERAGYRAIYLPRTLVYHQVRPEQMKLKWLYQRAFRTGREAAYVEIMSGRERGMEVAFPTSLFRRLCKSMILYLLTRASQNDRLRFDRGITFWKVRGMIYQYREERNKRRFIRSASTAGREGPCTR